jgi:hypothetical protein
VSEDKITGVYKAKHLEHTGGFYTRQGEILREFPNADERTDPAGFSWGDSGPGAFALARSVLQDWLGAPPSRQVSMDFAFKVIANLDPGSDFELDSDMVESFIDSVGGPEACKDEWEVDSWADAAETLTIETEVIDLDELLTKAPKNEPVTEESATKSYVAEFKPELSSAKVVLLAGSISEAKTGAVVEVSRGAIIVIHNRRFVVEDSGLREIN